MHDNLFPFRVQDEKSLVTNRPIREKQRFPQGTQAKCPRKDADCWDFMSKTHEYKPHDLRYLL